MPEEGLYAEDDTFTAALFKSVGLSTRLNECKLIFEPFVDVRFGQAVEVEFAGRELGQLLWLQRWNDEPVRDVDAKLVTAQPPRCMTRGGA